MFNGKKLGILSSAVGVSAGLLYALPPVIANILSTHNNVGLQSAIVATIVGVSFAVIGVTLNYSGKMRQQG
ncbi:hypothetical protein [Colwellia sp. UCD-KL20]|uniref:hypothetical protein n=1 Tax=Colwellia sp. UCD-KL20 TaxID=1917165 RepID=UPI0009708ACE|nr:hypothetical protein [Colwellia sp. UCD-KL20]